MTPFVYSLVSLLIFQRRLTYVLSSNRSSSRRLPLSTTKWTNCSSESSPRRALTSSAESDCRWVEGLAGVKQKTSHRRQRSALLVTPSGALEVSLPDCSRRRRTSKGPVRTSSRSDDLCTTGG